MAALSIQVPYPVFYDRDGQPLDNGNIYIGVTNLDPVTNPIAVYYDEALTIPASQPLKTSGGYVYRNGTPTQLYVNAVNFSILVNDSKNTLVYSFPDGTGISPNASGVAFTGFKGQVGHVSDLAGNDGSDWIGFDPDGIGAVARSAQDKMRDAISAKDFGAVGDGVTNDTVALKAFFDACIATGQSGHIPAGSYLVTAGQLVFDCNFVNVPWPQITTDGYESVKLLRADATDAPVISITNGTATGAAFNGWLGGSLGGMTFEQNGKATGANQHGLLLRGMVGTQFGYMRAKDQGGSCIHIEDKKFGATNPDPYNVAGCYFEAAEGNRCGQASFYNNNHVGLSGCTINYIRAINNLDGAFFGYGAANRINTMSVGSCKGWALGSSNSSAESRFSLGVAEFDNVEYGVNLKRLYGSDFGTIRFIHRYNFSALNPSGGYWPRICVQCGPTYSTTQIDMNIIDRIEAGGLKADLGQFFDFGNAGASLNDLRVRRYPIGATPFGLVATDFYTNFNANTRVIYTDATGAPYIDLLKKTTSIARAPTTFAIQDDTMRVVEYGTVLNNAAGAYDNTTFTYTCISPGVYRVAARIVIAAAIGTRIRMKVRGTANDLIGRNWYATTTNAQTYTIDGEFSLSEGDTINIQAAQNSGAPINLTAILSSGENSFFVTQV